jgi:hypothetical protein
MKLADLYPRWFYLDKDRTILGLTFVCPHCQDVRLGVAFHHHATAAFDDAIIHAKSPSTKHIWDMTGDSFENITLTPSVDASASGHWHGFIKNGEAT